MSDLTYYDVLDRVRAGRSLRGQYLWRADLSDADLNGADFSLTDLSDSLLRNCCAIAATFEGADLRRADFSGSDLRLANFRGADLRGADLRFSDIGGADFSEARLETAKLPTSPIEAESKQVGPSPNGRTKDQDE